MSTTTPTAPAQPLFSMSANGTLVVAPRVVQAVQKTGKVLAMIGLTAATAYLGAKNKDANAPALKGWFDACYW